MINKKTQLLKSYLSTGLILSTLLVSACSNGNEETAIVSVGTSTNNNTAIESQKNKIAVEQVTEPPEKETENELIILAKKITTEHKLTELKLECLTFELLDELYEGKHIIDVRELHSESCGGDINTSPRLFSIAVNHAAYDIWSDAKSMLGQLEKLN